MATATATTPENGTIHHDGDRLTLEAAPGQTVTGSTTLGPDESVTVRLRSTNSGSPFLRSIEAITDENGAYEARVDLGSIEPGTTFDVSGRYNGTKLASESGVVGECSSNCEPTATDTEPDDTTLLGVGALAAGSILAILGVAVMFGLVRS